MLAAIAVIAPTRLSPRFAGCVDPAEAIRSCRFRSCV
jgi:hypothetical protein